MNGFSVDSAQQAVRFAYMLAFGALSYLLYRAIPAYRRPGRRLRGMLLDAGFWLVILTAFILLILGPCGGELRLYHLFGAGCGSASAAWLTQAVKARHFKPGVRKEKT